MLVTKQLNIGYGKTIVQHDLNLQANAGDLICITGTNGSGKSTLLRTLASLQPAISGDILVNNQQLETLSNHELATTLSLVLTDNISVEHLTIFELVAMGRFPYTNWTGTLTDNDIQKVETAIEQVNLTHKKHCVISEVSDGEKQRAIIAKAIAQDTQLVLLDEPTAHLDLPNRIEIMLLLRKLSVNTRKTFILSTHELDLALQMADKIWLFTPNSVEIGIPEDLMLSGKFQQAFGSNSFFFDANDGHYQIKPLMGDFSVNVRGNTRNAIWLKRALTRCGIGTNDDSNIVIDASGKQFIIHEKQVETIAEVIDLLYQQNSQQC